MTFLYVCLFSNGCIKVGRSDNPKRRVAAHAERAGCLGVDMTQRSIFTCAGSSLIAEAKLIERCRHAASEIRRREWFFGLDYESVCKWAHDESLELYAVPDESPSTEMSKMLGSIQATSGLSQMEIGKRLGISQRTVGRLLLGQPNCPARTFFAIERLYAEITEQTAAA